MKVLSWERQQKYKSIKPTFKSIKFINLEKRSTDLCWYTHSWDGAFSWIKILFFFFLLSFKPNSSLSLECWATAGISLKYIHTYSHLVALPLSLGLSFYLHFSYNMEFDILLPVSNGENVRDLNPLIEKKIGNFS